MLKEIFTSCLYLFHFSTFLFFYLHFVYSADSESQEEIYGLAIPKDAKNRPIIPRREETLSDEASLVYGDVPANRCFCSYGHEEGVCDRNETCIKHPLAACFHSIELIHNATMKSMVTWHKYGCAALEKGSDASHLLCHNNVAHFRPKAIACCYEGDYCNLHIEPPPYKSISEDLEDDDFVFLIKRTPSVLLSLFVLVTFIFVLAIIFLIQRIRKANSLSKDHLMEKQPMLGIDDSGSGSGSGMFTLNQRTVAQDLKILKTIDQGRYGKVRKAEYRGSFVAVKTFNTTEEDSWKNERDVYQTQMLNHECILQFVAADINSEDSITQMLLITDYHELGSLYDYLRRESLTLELREAFQLAHSSISGIDHLHNSVLGTGSRRKPEIAHRDLKSKNIIVKRPGVCCIADFGMAVRLEGDKIIPEKVNIQVGTKRYMAPEVLSKELKTNDFEQFKRADIYSFALVMWEIARRCVNFSTLTTPSSSEESKDSNDSSGHDSGLGNSNSLTKPYECPFEGMVNSDPSLEEMRIIVCEKNYRPHIDPMWRDPSNPELSRFASLIVNCWNGNPHRRHTALKVKKELNDLLKKSYCNQDTIHSQGAASYKKESDSGIGSNGSSKERQNLIEEPV